MTLCRCLLTSKCSCAAASAYQPQLCHWPKGSALYVEIKTLSCPSSLPRCRKMLAKSCRPPLSKLCAILLKPQLLGYQSGEQNGIEVPGWCCCSALVSMVRLPCPKLFMLSRYYISRALRGTHRGTGVHVLCLDKVLSCVLDSTLMRVLVAAIGVHQ
jgi:hypothetical protein